MNLASIPESLKPIIGHETDDRFLIAGFVHDWLYDILCKLPLTREECDVIFLCLLIECGTNETLAHLMYWTVSVFGAQYYKTQRGLK